MAGGRTVRRESQLKASSEVLERKRVGKNRRDHYHAQREGDTRRFNFDSEPVHRRNIWQASELENRRVEVPHLQPERKGWHSTGGV